ncbi:unnamed protein product [Rotaria magnacalcarata]|uniref:Dynein intermediate chain 1, axonemal n=3 Tax=Rotaria magnacalcarata TaxID=392030 RepID=A0A819FQE6_9BILA|nr:unnamed protein product [Rotaria magnacalcarata]
MPGKIAEKKAAAPTLAGITAQRRLSQLPRQSIIAGFRDEDQDLGNMPDLMDEGLRAVRPEDQLKLTDAELNEEHTRILTARNPNAAENIVRFSYKERTFKPIPQVDQLAVHFQLDGNLIHKDSEEGKRQLIRDAEEHAAEEAEAPAAVVQETAKEGDDDDEDKLKKPATTGGKGKKLTNQFNFSERASQTYNNPCRDRETFVEQTPRAVVSDNVSQWSIFDAYNEDFDQQQKAKEKEHKKIVAKKDDERKKKFVVTEQSGDDMAKLARSKSASISLKILERMINQNTFDDIAQDFKYWEDAADEYREQEGSLLPLWVFQYELAKKLACTNLAWNTFYTDLFAVSFGSYDFLKQSRGMFLIYSLKNPSFPENIFYADTGVMSLDFHPNHPNLLCSGFYDGSVAVYNIAEENKRPKYQSTARNGKHTDPVWQVRWQKDDLDGNLNFYSISSDGRIVCWTLVKSDLMFTDVVQLKLEKPATEPDEGVPLTTLGCGTCFDFNKQQDYLFIAGTEEGKIHKCSKSYNNQYLDTFYAHHMAVYAVRWNTFHPKIFISCSADWTVKIWDINFKDPLFVYDLGSAVGDVAWAPYSATVFAACTADGKVFVFDLNVNKYEPLAEQIIVQKKRTKLTHIAFNQHFPIILAGDDRGNITSVKLSPNLRKKPKAKKGQEIPDGPEAEIAKLDKILALIRDPDDIRLDDISTTKTYDEHDHNDNSRTKSSLSQDSVDPEQELTRILTTKNPHGSKNLVMFSNRDKQFVPLGNLEQLIIHYSYEGNLMPVDSEEAKIYLQNEKNHKNRILPTALLDIYKTKEKSPIEIKTSNENFEPVHQIGEEDEQQTVTSEITEQSDFNELIDDLKTISKVDNLLSIEKPKKLLNRFNFCEQGIQTYTSTKKEVIIQTDPIIRQKFVGLANQRIIYQEYMIDYEKQQKNKDKRKQKVNYGSNKSVVEKQLIKTDRLKPETIVKRHQVQILKGIERVLNQNRYQELIYNFKYFEDKTDEVRDPMGTLFPLWKFPPSSANRSVTALTWNPAYSDMLIIGYGLYDRAERIQGAIAVFTLNNNHPNTLIHTESTVLSIDCLPSKPHLICVGLMDGDVIVYDISIPSGRAIFTNTNYTCKHFGCVWQVRWCTSSANHQPCFCSVGSDGKIMRWTCIKGDLRQVVLFDLPSSTKTTRLDDSTLLSLPDPAIAFDFHRIRTDIFLVGTEDGKIYKASIDDPGIIDVTFDAHEFAVYAVQWSPFHPNVFVSCSADGTVKIWHEKINEYLMRFDLCTSLQDIAWSPYTSTMFTVAGADGKVYMFDIYSNKLEPICEQRLAKESRKMCTKIAFNPIHPILLVGDETLNHYILFLIFLYVFISGWTICLKLSPNLRKKAKIRKDIDIERNYNLEFHKLAQELSRTGAGDSMNDIFNDQMNDIED